MVIRRIQEETLRTYLLTYATVYSTVSLNHLAETFELDYKTVHSLIRYYMIHSLIRYYKIRSLNQSRL